MSTTDHDNQEQRARAVTTRGRTLALTSAVLTADEQQVRAIMADLAADPDGGAASAAVILDLAAELGGCSPRCSALSPRPSSTSTCPSPSSASKRARTPPRYPEHGPLPWVR